MVNVRKMFEKKRIALIAHDAMKQDMLDWAKFNKLTLSKHKLWATGTTGTLLRDELKLNITAVLSGPLGGDQQIGAMVASQKIDIIIFFWSPLESHAHGVDIAALQRIATVHNVVLACDRATADFVLSSPLMHEEYEILVKDYSDYINRFKEDKE